jgi:hypothetical protein
MTELYKVMIGAAAAMAIIYLIGPTAIWRITRAAAEWMLVILFLVWAL